MFQILVVEDDKELCDLFCTVLTDNGYTAVLPLIFWMTLILTWLFPIL